MKVNVFIERERKDVEIELKDNSTVKDLLKILKINPVTVITTINDEVITEDYKLNDKDKIEIHSVVSGG
ncbi:MAG: MoaD/ThiS family protein [Nanoarchaeota archaeon]